MPSFEELFIASRGRPVEYEGKTLLMMDRIPMTGVKTLRVVFEHRGGEWRQGVGLNCDGSFRVNEQLIHGKTGLVLWEDTAPQSAIIEVVAATEVRVKNVWDGGDGVIESWHNGAAMVAEDVPGGRRYRCNDREPDDDFDDIVFRVERVA